ncbi:MAG: glycoside hydrolase family 2 TIM barrel-domain containing protein [Clostridium sp.]|nr:glycoside hydrolase family 2 TIM barrel-domain containing protein [Clostridium sp.]
MEHEIPNTSWLSNLSIYSVNRIEAHSDHKYYLTKEEADSGEMVLRQSLNGNWKFSFALNPNSRIKDFYKTDFNCKCWDNISVPGHIQLQGYDKPQYLNLMYPWDGDSDLKPGEVSEEYNPVGSYVKYFNIDNKLKRDSLYISFQGVETAFYVWFNGKFVGYSEDSFTPSEFELTDYVIEGENKLAVEVYKRSTGSWLEDQDFWLLSGIFRDVYLYSVPKTHVQDLFVKTDLDDSYINAVLNVDLKIKGDMDSTVDLILMDKNNEEICKSLETKVEDNLSLRLQVNNVKLWSSETPYLYKMYLFIKDQKGNIAEVLLQKVGFRKFQIVDKIMRLNGKRIIFKGINRHEFDCIMGRAITKRDMLWDIKFLKKNNINAVRTSHYPNQSYWYELCDEYGIYLIDETNLETHGSWQKIGAINPDLIIPGSKKEWFDIVLDRAVSMVQRDKNHPSILMWSCGNESFGGENIYKMSKYFKEKDPSRIVHYEGIFHDRTFNDTSDVESRMYEPARGIEEYLKNDPKKPFMSCEYMHAMGNSCGAMDEYVELEDKYEMYQGGFIWDYIDQFLVKKNRFSEDFLAYGGDFDDRPTDYNFCGDGIVYADRKASPKVQEVKKLYQNIDLSIDENGVKVRNKNLFIDTSDYIMEYSLWLNGKKIYENFENVIVKAGEEKYVSLKFPERNKSGEYAINVAFKLKSSSIWAEKGHTVAFEQFVYEKRGFKEVNWSKENSKLNVIYGDVNIGVKNKDFSVLFSRQEGGIVSLIYDGKEMITRRPMPIYWRATTDNDNGANFGFKRGKWLEASMFQKCTDINVTQNESDLTVEYTYSLPISSEVKVKVAYTVYVNGEIKVKCIYKGTSSLPKLPIFGLTFKISADYDSFKWYGMGPEENYIDRKHGAHLGIFEKKVVENVSNYAVPQESGNHTDVRWAKVKDKNGFGIEFGYKDKPFELGISPYTAFELQNALHYYELPRVNYTVVTIAARQMGVGGDDSWGAQVHEKYTIDSSKDIFFEFVMRKCK